MNEQNHEVECEHCGHDATDCMCLFLRHQLAECGIPVLMDSVQGEYSDGYGGPWCIVRVGDVEIAAIEAESDDYDPEAEGLRISGWAWRRASEEMVSGGWSDSMDTVAEALAEARAALAQVLLWAERIML